MSAGNDFQTDDKIIRFIFDNHGVKGEILSLKHSTNSLFENHSYPSCIKSLLCEMAAAALLTAAPVKDRSKVMLQLKSDSGPLDYALINVNEDLSFYGSAALREEAQDDLPFEKLCPGDAVLVLSIFSQNDTRWQGVVPVSKLGVASSLEEYFYQSEQLPTRFVIVEGADRSVTALMLQIVSDIDDNQNSLEHLLTLAHTLTAKEMQSIDLYEALRRLYGRESVRTFEPQSVAFKCNCSRERCLEVLKSLSKQVLEDLQKEEVTTFNCEHCRKQYSFAKEQIAQIARQKEEKEEQSQA